MEKLHRKNLEKNILDDEDDSQIEAYKFKSEINNKIIIRTIVMRYAIKTQENIKEKNSNLYFETTFALLRNIHVTTNMNSKFTNIYYNDTEATKIKKLMNMFCSYKNRADLKLENKIAYRVFNKKY